MTLIKITEDSLAARLAGVNRDTLNNGDLSADVTSPKCKECLGTEEPQVDNTYNNYAAGPECLRVHFDMEFTDNNHVGISQLTKLVRSTGADGATATKVLSNEVIACAVKGDGPQRELNPPGNWFAPPGSNQSSRGGNETAEASGAEGR